MSTAGADFPDLGLELDGFGGAFGVVILTR
jgi:hypothetical protein